MWVTSHSRSRLHNVDTLIQEQSGNCSEHRNRDTQSVNKDRGGTSKLQAFAFHGLSLKRTGDSK